MSNVRVVAAVVDTRQLTLYKEDGDTVLIPQGDPRLRKILDEVTPICSQGGVATINIAEHNPYEDFEEKTGGFTRFFRVARSKVASFFGASQHDTEQDNEASSLSNRANYCEPVAPTQIGQVPTLSTAIDEIIAHAKPTSGAVATNETVVAVVGSGKEAKVIPGMENLKSQFVHACKLGSTKGVENFLKRISAVIDQRQHSIHDLLRFMERGDLPIADDGSIVIYKILRRSKEGNAFVDCHSGNVTQRVGSYVCMDPSMVDHNRRNECSNGLHVARRGYLSNFPGDVCVLAKVAPEDVIAVPNYDANKMRVCGYHIISELDDQSFNKLKNNRPMTDNEKAQALLGRAISGDHIGRIEEVRITQARGGGVVITPLDSKGQKIRAEGPAPKVTALDDVQSAPSVDPREVEKQVTKAKTEVKPATAAPTANSRQRTARDLHDAGDIQALMTFKRKSKVSWSSLGFSEEEQKSILSMAAAPAKPVPTPAPKPATKPAPTVKAPAKKAAPVKTLPKPVKPKLKAEAKPSVGRPSIEQGGGRKARMFELEKVYSDKKADPAHRAAAALELVSLRGKAKKSWAALGYPKLTDQLLMSDVDAFRKAATAANDAKPKKYPDTNAGRARKLFDEKKWGPLADFSKNTKKGLKALGFTDKEVAEIKLHIGD